MSISKTPKKENGNLLILAPFYETFIKGFGEYLANYYDKIYVIIPKWWRIRIGNKDWGVFKNVDRSFSSRRENVEIHEVPVSFIFSLAILKMKKYFKRNGIKFDLILSHFILPYGFLGLGVSFPGCKNIVVAHRYDVVELPFKNFFLKRLTKRVLRNTEVVVTVSDYNKKILKSLFSDKKIHVFPIGFDPEIFNVEEKKRVREKLGLVQNKKIIISVGRLIEHKNHRTLISSLKLLKDRGVIFEAYFLGEGKEKKELQKKIMEDELGDFVFLKGYIKNEEIPLWLNSSDLFVLPSFSEGLPTVLVEALACGVPVVASDIPGNRELIVSDDYGFLYGKPEDVKSLSKMIREGLEKDWNREVICRYAERLSWEKMVKEFYKVLTR